MPYPDTTRTVYVKKEAVEGVSPPDGSFIYMHTMNEPAHTLNNGLVALMENTGTRVRRSGQARGKRSSTIRIQGYLRMQELGTWLDSAIGEGIHVPYPDRRVQTVTITGSPTGGTFTLEVDGSKTTPLVFNAAAGVVQAALEALPNVGSGNVTVAGAGPYTVTFTRAGILPGAQTPTYIVGDYRKLTPAGGAYTITATSTPTIAGAFLRTYRGGVGRGKSLTILVYNGLYWRKLSRCFVNTCNVQGFGGEMAMIDMEIMCKAGAKVAAPTPEVADDDYVPVDMPMQSVRFGGLTNADVVRMSLQINNNLAYRTTMDGTTSVGRVRFGDFDVAIDGMADYPVYEGSIYEAFELGNRIAALDVLFFDDLHTVGSGTLIAGTAINPYALFRIPQPVLEDTAEGDDGGELVQMVRGAAELDPIEACAILVEIATDKPSTYYDAA